MHFTPQRSNKNRSLMVNVAVVYQDLMAKVNLIISCIEDGVWESLLWRHEVQRGQPLGLWLTQERQEGPQWWDDLLQNRWQIWAGVDSSGLGCCL